MPFFLLIVFEVMAFSALAEKFGFLKTLGGYWIPSFLLMLFTPIAIRRLKAAQVETQDSFSGLNQLLFLIGFFLCMIPLLLSRAIGIFLVLPGLRHVLIWKFRNAVQRKTHQYFHQFGNGFRFYYQNSGTTFDESTTMKDVTPQPTSKLNEPNP